MAEVREMPYSEKLAGIVGFKELVEDFAPRLVRRELGGEKSDELRGLWEKGMEPFPEGATDRDRYEVAYRNFLRDWVTAAKFMGEHQGEDGTRRYMRAAIDAWERKYAFSALQLRLVGFFSPKSSFRILANHLAYDLQVFSPFKVSELDDRHMTLEVAPCKIAETSEHGDFCLMACQNIVPAWLESQFKVRMNSERRGSNCAVTFSPF